MKENKPDQNEITKQHIEAFGKYQCTTERLAKQISKSTKQINDELKKRGYIGSFKNGNN